jgi:hypothetical protein
VSDVSSREPLENIPLVVKAGVTIIYPYARLSGFMKKSCVIFEDSLFEIS